MIPMTMRQYVTPLEHSVRILTRIWIVLIVDLERKLGTTCKRLCETRSSADSATDLVIFSLVANRVIRKRAIRVGRHFWIPLVLTAWAVERVLLRPILFITGKWTKYQTTCPSISSWKTSGSRFLRFFGKLMS